MKTWGVWLYGLALAGLISLIFFMPKPMISPGRLIPAHGDLEGQCSSCHAPFQGAVPDRCITCHAVASIGLRTSKGVLIATKAGKVPFHQSLTTQNCMSCHTDHPGRNRAAMVQPTFSHNLLEATVRSNCASCHAAPVTAFHAEMKGQCSSCHTQQAWKPAAFDHARFFALTGPHNVACTTCHTVAGDFGQHSCTTCHEHSPARIAQQHREEGITNTANCMTCHRNGSQEGHGGDGQDDDD
jgi:hypothetical protein